MKIFKLRTLVCLSISLLMLQLLSNSVYSQESAAEKSVAAWSSKLKTSSKAVDASYFAIGLSVQKPDDRSIQIDAAIAASAQINELKPMEFIVQPLQDAAESKSESDFTEIGSPSKISLPNLRRNSSSYSEIIASPQTVIRFVPNVRAVRISVRFVSDPSEAAYSVILPVESDPRSAVIGKILENCSENFGDCSWFTGSCGEGGTECQGRTLCAACSNNSPHLNCASCTMGCANGGTCNPDGPAPIGCSEN
ncbi:MAG: hypothetical protein KIS76_08405 [Pyrinomonadaceae bacterium]|nr:hypothetical protein [Pyrinomonadaceae bacterium]